MAFFVPFAREKGQISPFIWERENGKQNNHRGIFTSQTITIAQEGRKSSTFQRHLSFCFPDAIFIFLASVPGKEREKKDAG